MPGTLLSRAKAGEPVYITDVRKTFEALPDDASFTVTVALHCLNGDIRIFPLRLPLFLNADGEEQKLTVEYFLAEMYNMLSSLGGKKITLHCAGHEKEGARLLDAFRTGFCVDLPTSRRTAYGNCLNVIDRMLPALPAADGEAARFAVAVSGEAPPNESRSPAIKPAGGAAEVFRQAAEDLGGKTLLGVDIGGTDIKLAVAMDGRLILCKEYDWYPAALETVEDFVYPVKVLAELMAWASRAERDGDEAIREMIEPALDRHATADAMAAAVGAAREAHGDVDFRFDGIGMSFPDVVVENKIVGGETLKTRGMRTRWGDGYDAEFAKLTHLDEVLKTFVKPNGAVGIVNDGPMAAFTAGVEAAVKTPEAVQQGVFAHTLGTELGTGWVTETGASPDIPLEVYNFIIDLGSYPERAFHPDDVRSVDNFNTRLSGTLQKYCSQSGVFRLAFKYLPAARPDIVAQIRAKGFVVDAPDGSIRIPTEPKDMRKPFLEFMMELAEKENDPALDRIFEEIGVALAVTGMETDRLLEPAAKRRTLFGRLVKRAACFDLMRRGAVRYDPAADLAVADDGIAETTLMRELSRNSEYTVAQFAQAVGAVYYANYILRSLRNK